MGDAVGSRRKGRLWTSPWYFWFEMDGEERMEMAREERWREVQDSEVRRLKRKKV